MLIKQHNIKYMFVIYDFLIKVHISRGCPIYSSQKIFNRNIKNNLLNILETQTSKNFKIKTNNYANELYIISPSS